MSSQDSGDHSGPEWVARKLGITAVVVVAVRRGERWAYAPLRLLAAFVVRQHQRWCSPAVASYGGEEELAAELFKVAVVSCWRRDAVPADVVLETQRAASKLLSRERRHRAREVMLDERLPALPAGDEHSAMRPLIIRLGYAMSARLSRHWKREFVAAVRAMRELERASDRHHARLRPKFVLALTVALKGASASLLDAGGLSEAETHLLQGLQQITNNKPGRGDRRRAHACACVIQVLALHGLVREDHLD